MDLKKIAALVKTRIEVFPEIGEMIDFFEAVPEYDVDMYTNKKNKTNAEKSLPVLQELLPVIEAQEDFTNDALYQMLRGFADEKVINQDLLCASSYRCFRKAHDSGRSNRDYGNYR